MVLVIDPMMPCGEEQELMEFRTSGFLVCFSVVFKGNPECHKQDADDENC